MNRRNFLRCSALAVSGSALASPASAITKTILANSSVNIKKGESTNILIIFADQMHGFAMGCMNHPDVKTPNMDKLASEGTLFRNAYSNAPICTPFRCVLFSGRYGSQTDVLNNRKRVPAGTRTFADAFNDGGYKTSYVGKWHLGATGNQVVPKYLRAGFTEFIGYQCYNDFVKGVLFFDENGVATPSKDHRTKETTDIAIERLKKIAKEKFAMVVSYQNPHYPEQPTLKYGNMYKNLNPTRRPNCTNDPNFDPYIGTNSPPSPKPKQNDPVWQDYGNDIDQYLRQYYAMITQMDADIGRLLQAVDKLGLRDNTVVLFTSDHGDMQGSHSLKNKSVFWEESTRIPMIVRAPGGVKGQVSDYLVSGIDIYPSCLGFAGLPQETTTEGNDFTPLVLAQKQLSPKPIFSELASWAMIREGNYKLTVSKSGWYSTHLFNLEEDPYELNNRVNHSSYNTIKSDLLAKIIQWRDYVEFAQ